jgi:hypothetical protein
VHTRICEMRMPIYEMRVRTKQMNARTCEVRVPS